MKKITLIKQNTLAWVHWEGESKRAMRVNEGISTWVPLRQSPAHALFPLDPYGCAANIYKMSVSSWKGEEDLLNKLYLSSLILINLCKLISSIPQTYGCNNQCQFNKESSTCRRSNIYN